MRASHPTRRRMPLLSFLLWAGVGFGAGLINGLLGAAGGILLVAVLPALPSPPPPLSGGNPFSRPGADRRDLLTTALAVMLPISAVSAIRYWRAGIRPDVTLLVSLLLPVAVGGFLGAVLLERTPQTLLRRIFAAVVLVSGLKMLWG